MRRTKDAKNKDQDGDDRPNYHQDELTSGRSGAPSDKAALYRLLPKWINPNNWIGSDVLVQIRSFGMPERVSLKP